MSAAIDEEGGRACHATGIPTGAVGLITDPHQVEAIIATGQANAVLLGRELLRNPSWPQHAALELDAQPRWPDQYGYAVQQRNRR